MKIHLLGGFLGSGKTTAIRYACEYLLQQDVSVAVITNDQGSRIVDDEYFRSLQLPARFVSNGCFCCNFSTLKNKLQSLIEEESASVIFAESVGSCTDIVATVMKPLQKLYPSFEISVSIFADASLLYDIFEQRQLLFNTDVHYIYAKQLEEAGIIVVNKIDQLDTTARSNLKREMDSHFPNKLIIYQNSLNVNDIKQWIRTLNSAEGIVKQSSLTIDYDTYAAGEAALAWFDEEIEISSHRNNAVRETIALIKLIYQKIVESGYPIAHLKFLLDHKTKISFTAKSADEVNIDQFEENAFSSSLLINARVQAGPEQLTTIISDACKQIQIDNGCTISVIAVAAFSPGYPTPEFRFNN